MADYYLRKWSPANGQSRDISPDIFVWDQVIKSISTHSQGRDAVGLLLGSARTPAGNEPHVVMIEDIVPPQPLSSPNGELSQTTVAELFDDWRNNYRDKQIVGWFRTISNPPRQLRLLDNDATIHQSYFTQPYQVALAFSQQSTEVYLGFFKSNQGKLDVERIYPFIELSDSPSPAGLPIRNLAVTESSQQATAPGGRGRLVSQSNQGTLPLILRLGLPLLILLAVLTPFLYHFGVITTSGEPEGSSNVIELAIPSADKEGKSLISSSMLGGPAEGIKSITFENRVPNDNEVDKLWIERLAVNPQASDPPGGFIDYAYYSIAASDSAKQSTITFEFEIPEHWKELRDIGMHTIRAYRSSGSEWSNFGSEWSELTKIGDVSLEQGKYVFKASSEGFSYFALGGTRANQRVEVTVESPSGQSPPKPTQEPTLEPTPKPMLEPTPKPTLELTPKPTLDPVSTQKVSYKPSPENGGKIVVYLDAQYTSECAIDTNVPEGSEKVYVCPKNTTIYIQAIPSDGYAFSSFVMPPKGKMVINNVTQLALEEMDMVIHVNFSQTPEPTPTPEPEPTLTPEPTPTT